ncbi:hypothetical protein JTF06_08820 [Desemzia sp. RIT804]|uniref:hypothetical protein n=1 Tax=Desemzia sp. RIT 804 TaxID=2810209 RepID=UPI00194E485A|nr:hypothetical protein [Desemzia sp. RIT 804]MBM6614992.1 hypothetical protein [Desemzia sp. RIT 804]
MSYIHFTLTERSKIEVYLELGIQSAKLEEQIKSPSYIPDPNYIYAVVQNDIDTSKFLYEFRFK